MYIKSKIIILLYTVMETTAFFQNKLCFTVVKPKTNEELTNALCSKTHGRLCVDDQPTIIILDRVFDFIETEGKTTELGCWQCSSPLCYKKGQQRLNINNQCTGLEPVNVTYDNAGRNPLLVGSNRYLTSTGQGGIKGKGISIISVYNVVIQNISITYINPQVIWGGDAIAMDNVTNVLIDRNYVQYIGRQMVVTGFGACQNVTISNNEFNGYTPFSVDCNDRHYWTLLFLGKNDTITMYNNTIHQTSGRMPHMTGLMNSTVLLHMIENTFYNISLHGGIQAIYPTATLLVEGNNYTDVARIVGINHGSMYFPLTQAQCDACIPYLGRPCEANIIVNSDASNVGTDVTVLNILAPYASVLTKPTRTEPNKTTPTPNGNNPKSGCI